jgi:hypothetical protein
MRSNNIDDFPVLDELDESVYAAKEKQLLDELERCSPNMGVDWNNVRYSKERFRRVIDMVERRRIYFHVFHNGMNMGELNEACLLSFWILKLYPFFDVNDPDCNVTLVFALKLFTNAVSYTANKRDPKQRANLSHDVMSHLIHAFIFRDLSKEALMALAESLIISSE